MEVATSSVQLAARSVTTAQPSRWGQWRSVAVVPAHAASSRVSSTVVAVAPTRDDGATTNALPRLSTGRIQSAYKLKDMKNARLSFTQAFGRLGLPMAFVAVVCVLWTTWLIFLACAPNWTANHLMNTESFDDGSFWLIVETEPWMRVLSVTVLLLVDLCYIYVLLKMLVWRNREVSLTMWFTTRGMRSSRAVTQTTSLWTCLALGSRPARALLALWRDLTGFSGVNRKFWNLWLKTVDLALQSVALAKILEAGFPPLLVHGYASLIAVNALSCVATIHLGTRLSAFVEVLVDSIFDLLFAVAAPIVVLAYSYSNFDFDRDVLTINDEVFPSGAFERQARMLADPSEVFLFRNSFDSLRILTATDVILRIGMNLSFCYRFKRVVEVQIATRKRVITHRQLDSASARAQKHIPRYVALLFGLFSVSIVAATSMCIATSRAACAAFPQCVLHAHRWHSGDQCPCLVLIDERKVLSTYDEWLDPGDVTEAVQHLARAGALRVLQLHNRRLPHLPDELRRCRHLHHLSLMYTATEAFPDWTAELTELEFLTTEDKMGLDTLVHLPDHLFRRMHALTYLHFGIHARLAKLPSFDGLSGLKQAMFAYLFAVTELPSFAPLTKLERLQLVYFSSLPSIPDMAPLTNLQHLTVYRPNQICCNGFLGAATCNLSHPFCTANARASIPPVACLQDEQLRVTAATKAVFEKNAASVCQGASAVIPEQPTRATVDMCGGIAYRQCTMPRADNPNVLATGICFHTRMQVLACTLDPLKQQMRRLQIQRGVGPVCDPDVEAWLGCA